jgi:putative spermidine/putrescine transport system ATP-binding protein
MNEITPLGITLKGCAKSFGTTRVLEPLDLTIEPGETLVLLGPSGCGKTTTLRLIAGLEQPDAGGQVLFDGQDVSALGIEKRNIGMVFQSYALFPNMSVAQNIGYGLKIRKMPLAERRARIDEMLAMMRIEALADRAIDQLSGGQRQRVALARALAAQPRALLLDEPLTALDARLRDTLRTEINLLLRSLGITAIYVTHDQAEAMALGDRIVVMEHGRVAQVGAPRDIYHHPASAFVADFVGSMNRLPGHAVAQGFETPAGTLNWKAPEGVKEILFRPEDTRLAPDGALAGTVTAAFFLGERLRLLVDAGGEVPLIVDAPSRAPLQAGSPVRLALDSAGIITLGGSSC